MEFKVFDKVTLSLVKVISINFELNSLEKELEEKLKKADILLTKLQEKGN